MALQPLINTRFDLEVDLCGLKWRIFDLCVLFVFLLRRGIKPGAAAEGR